MSRGARVMYGTEVRTSTDFQETVSRVRRALDEQGFGVLTEIDVAATLQAKIGVEVAPQVILGACNPGLAHRALQVEPGIGLLLPCNVVVRRDGADTVVALLDPQLLATLTGRAELASIAAEAARRLGWVLAAAAHPPDADPAPPAPGAGERS